MSSTAQGTGLSGKAIQGTAWRYLTFFVSKLMVFISTLVLARLLTKDDFGLVGYALTAVTFLDVISDFGVGPALIYMTQDDRTSSTAFWLTLAMGVIVCAVAWALSPFVGDFFHDPRVVPITRVLAFSFPLNALGSTQGQLLRKGLAFGRTFVPDFLKAVVKGVASIAFAIGGLGAWSLVWGQMSGFAAAVIALWIITPWHPTFHFDLKIARALLNYGINIVGVELLSIVLLNMDYLLVGRFLGTVALGVYTLGFRLPDLLVLQFARIVGDVVFPIFSRVREAAGSLARGFVVTARYVSLFTLPLGVGLALVARPLTLILFTSKWIDAAPVIQGIAIYATTLSLIYNAGDVYKAEGRPQVITWLTLLQIVLLFPALWWAVTVSRSTAAVGWMQALVALVSALVNTVVACRLLNIRLREMGAALWPSLMAAAAMVVLVWPALHFTQPLSPWIQLISSVGLGVIGYGGALFLWQRPVIWDGLERIRGALKLGVS